MDAGQGTDCTAKKWEAETSSEPLPGPTAQLMVACTRVLACLTLSPITYIQVPPKVDCSQDKLELLSPPSCLACRPAPLPAEVPSVLKSSPSPAPTSPLPSSLWEPHNQVLDCLLNLLKLKSSLPTLPLSHIFQPASDDGSLICFLVRV